MISQKSVRLFLTLFGSLLNCLPILLFSEEKAFSPLEEFNKEPVNNIIELTLLERLAKEHPQSSIYWYELGNAYYKAHLWGEAIIFFKRSLEIKPNNPDAKVLLGYAILFRHMAKGDLQESQALFENVLKEYPTYEDAKKGIDRIKNIEKPIQPVPIEVKLENIVKKHPENAEYLYQRGNEYYKAKKWDEAIVFLKKSLELKPNNADAKVLLGYAILFKHIANIDLHESQALFENVLTDYPKYEEAKKGIERIKKIEEPLQTEPATVIAKKEAPPEKIEKKEAAAEKPKENVEDLLKVAKDLSKEEDYSGAIEIYLYLTKKFPKNAEYFFNLGVQYRLAKSFNEAIEALTHALELKPDYQDALVALGSIYSNVEKISLSLKYLSLAIQLNPKNVDALMALANVQKILEHDAHAKYLYETVLEIEPENLDAIKSLASIEYNNLQFKESSGLYRFLYFKTGDRLTYIPTLFDVTSHTRPSFLTQSSIAEEKEKSAFTGKWEASIKYLNASAALVFPINNNWRATLSARTGTMKQKNLISNTVLFDVEFDGGALKTEWFINKWWTIIGTAGVEWDLNHDKKAFLPTQHGEKFLPGLIFRYSDNVDTVYFGEATDTYVFRDFVKKHLRVFTRDAILTSYKHDFGNNYLLGADGAWLFYQDPIHNQEQDFSGWFQMGIPYFEDTFSAGYNCIYRQFNKETTGYYSFQYQLTHWLRVHWLKKWCQGFRCDAEYWHGWRITRGKNPQQQIVVNPLNAIIPVITQGNQIDWVFLTIGYNPSSRFDSFLSGSYYHDSFDYTIWLAKIGIEWRF